MRYTADFETTTDPEDCRVWAFGLCNIDNPDEFAYGNSIESFFTSIERLRYPTLYFHNEKFDGEFIIHYLLTHGYKHNTDSRNLETKEFGTLISDKGVFYSIKICFSKGSKKNICTIYDSLKIIPLGIDDVAKAFGLPINKLHIDYDEYRPPGHKLTEKEVQYLKHDVQIAAMALKAMFDQGLTKMTQGSNALHDYKDIVGKNFKKWFPVPDYDYDIRQSYKGGFTYLKKGMEDVDIGQGIVLDVNSLYPSVMRDMPLPYGEGKYFDGQYEYDEQYNLYVQMFTCTFELKKDHIPTIQMKNNLAFVPTEYLESSNGEEVTLCLTSVDLNLFLSHYDVDWANIDWIGGWKFKSSTHLFVDYVDKWTAIKIKADEEHNKGLRQIAKLMLNSLYGKFALNPNVRSKYPYLLDGVVKYQLGPKETREPIYIPVGTFITAWARYKTITSAQKVYDRFIYADTDSLHLIGLEEPEGLEIHPTKLGAWKHESTFHRARFIRAKRYYEDEYVNTFHAPSENLYGPTSPKITCAGMPSSCYKNVTWDNFHPGMEYTGKLKMQHVPGGIVLSPTPFTLQR